MSGKPDWMMDEVPVIPRAPRLRPLTDEESERFQRHRDEHEAAMRVRGQRRLRAVREDKL